MILPADDFILLSLINTALRDKYSCFAELCDEEDLSADEIASRLNALGYVYSQSANAFIIK